MKLIVPMAGRGTRLRPHTHVTPKPLLPVAGRTMVERIVETFAAVLPRSLHEAVFILGPDFGSDVSRQLTSICERYGMDAHFRVQEEALGTAHAVLQAGDHLAGECVVVFADTLFYMDETPELGTDGVIWVKHVDDPRRFGVVVKEAGRITAFVEKPEEPISHEAIIGIYYIRDGARLRRAITDIIAEDIKGHGEYQLTDALDRLLQDGLSFATAPVSEWLDCGTIAALKETTGIILSKEGENNKRGTVVDATLREPVYIGEGAEIRGSEVGPHVSVEAGAVIVDSTISESIVFGGALVHRSRLSDSVVGHHAEIREFSGSLNVGDHSRVG